MAGFAADSCFSYSWSKWEGSLLARKKGFLVVAVALSASLGSFLFGLSMASLNTATKMINSEFRQCAEEGRVFTYNQVDCIKVRWQNAVLASSVLAGAAAGAALGGRVMRYGRRSLMCLLSLIFMIGIIGEGTSGAFSSLLASRLLVGVGVGLSSVTCPTYLAEMTPATSRGAFGVLHQLMVAVGILVATLLGLPLLNPAEQPASWSPPSSQLLWWRFMILIGLVPALALLVLFGAFFDFESPFYYLENNKTCDARKCLQLLHAKSDVTDELEALEGAVAQANGSHGKSGGAWKVVLLGVTLAALQQLGGINVIITSSSDLFAKAGLSGRLQTLASIAMAGLNVVVTFPTIILIEKMGRRVLMLIGTFFQFLFLLPAVGAYWLEQDVMHPQPITQYLAIAAILGYVTFFALAYGPVLWVYLFEIFPLDVKNSAASTCTCVNWISSVLIVFVGVAFSNKISFSLFAGFQGVAFLLVLFAVRETKGRQLGDSPYIKKPIFNEV